MPKITHLFLVLLFAITARAVLAHDGRLRSLEREARREEQSHSLSARARVFREEQRVGKLRTEQSREEFTSLFMAVLVGNIEPLELFTTEECEVALTLSGHSGDDTPVGLHFNEPFFAEQLGKLFFDHRLASAAFLKRTGVGSISVIHPSGRLVDLSLSRDGEVFVVETDANLTVNHYQDFAVDIFLDRAFEQERHLVLLQERGVDLVHLYKPHTSFEFLGHISLRKGPKILSALAKIQDLGLTMHALTKGRHRIEIRRGDARVASYDCETPPLDEHPLSYRNRRMRNYEDSAVRYLQEKGYVFIVEKWIL